MGPVRCASCGRSDKLTPLDSKLIQIQVTYKSYIDEELDKSIIEAMTKVVGAQWCSRGFDMDTKERDLNFDYGEGDACKEEKDENANSN